MTRVIAGRAGSMRLEVPKTGTRPTSDRVREAVFSALDSWGLVEGCRVLDLYAGSGALGLEAASRGAAEVTLVERHSGASRVAERNARTVLRAFGEDDPPRLRVVTQAVLAFLEGADRGDVYDAVLIDPPYDLAEPDLAAVLRLVGGLVASDGAVLVERSTRTPEPAWPGTLARFRQRRYGETVLWWAEAVAAG